MQKPDSNETLPLAIGQFYQINSFDLGFINITPTDLLLEIKALDPPGNEVLVSVLPLPDKNISPEMIAIARWFTHTYPTRTADDCRLKNAAAFADLVNCGLATLHQPDSSEVFLTLLTGIQRTTPWPIISNAINIPTATRRSR